MINPIFRVKGDAKLSQNVSRFNFRVNQIQNYITTKVRIDFDLGEMFIVDSWHKRVPILKGHNDQC